VLAHVQQVLASGLLLLFGVLALRVWRRAGPARTDRATLAWGLTAAYFVVGGGYSTLHALASAAARVAGTRSVPYRLVGEWAIALNLGRGALSVVYAALLLALLVSSARWPTAAAQRALPLLLLAAAALTALALPLPMRTIYWLGTGLAVLSMVTAMVMMVALLAAVLNDGVDELLWLALALYAFKETMSVSLFAIVAWWSLSADGVAWHLFYVGSTLLVAGMSALGARRLRLAGEGRPVPALFEHLHALRRSPAS
jgi:hypothetical protein